MASQVTLKALGLNYSPNNLSLPEGSLLVANDVIVRRDNVVESRRGFKDYSAGLGNPDNNIKQLLEYKSRIIAHYNDKLGYDTQVLNSQGRSVFADFSGTYNETEPGLRIKSISANKNLYFTTSEGIKRLSAKTASDLVNASIVNAGAVKAIDLSVALDFQQGQLSGFLPVDSTVAYRVLWGYKDKNDNTILGAPSDRISLYNYLSNVLPLDLNTLLVNLDIVSSKMTITGIATDGINPVLIYPGANHGLSNGDIVHITDTNTTPSIVGSFPITVVAPNSFTIPVVVSSIGSISGTVRKSLFTDQSYYNTFGTSIEDDAQVLKDNVMNLAEKMDNDLLFADSTGGGNPLVPLKMNSVQIDAGSVGRVNFSSNPANFLSIGDKIKIEGFTTEPVNTNLSLTQVSGTSDNPQNPVSIAYTGSTSITNGQSITISGTNTSASVNGTFIATVSTNTISSTSGGDSIAITNIVSGNATITTAIHGLVSPTNLNDAIYINGTGVPNLPNGIYYIKSIPTNNQISVSSTPNGSFIVPSGSSTSGNFVKELTINTTTNHNIVTGNYINISDSNSSPSINGNFLVTSSVSGSNVFKIVPQTAILSQATTGTTKKTTIPVNVSSVTTGTGTINVSSGNNLKLFNGEFTISRVDEIGNYIEFNIPDNTATFTATTVDSTSKIFSYNYRDIVNTGDELYPLPLKDVIPSIPATSQNLRIIQNTVLRIADKLKTEKSYIITDTLQTKIITPYNVTSASNAKVQITVPNGITRDYFYQVYRTRVFTAEGSQTLGASGAITVTPDDEMRLVYEAFPPFPFPSSVTFTDTYPEDLALTNANLYTNPITGEGIENANDIPPFAKDINVFKNTTFYANTKTRQRLNPIQLLGTSNIGGENNNKLTIANKNGFNNYVFTPGIQQQVDIKIDSLDDDIIRSSLYLNRFFVIYTPSKKYLIWYRYDQNDIKFSSVVSSGNITTFTIDYSSYYGTVFVPGGQYRYTITGLDSSVNVNGNQIATFITPDTFTIPINCGTINSFSSATMYPWNPDAIPIRLDLNSNDFSYTCATKIANLLSSRADEFIASNLLEISNIAYGDPETTITTSTPHKLSAGDTITISGVIQTGPATPLDGVFNIVSAPSPTTFTVYTAGSPTSLNFSSAVITSPVVSVTNVEQGIALAPFNGLRHPSIIYPQVMSLNITAVGDGEDANASPPKVLLSQAASRGQAIDETARSLVRVINKQATSSVYAYYISGESTSPGIINLEAKNLSDPEFYVIADGDGVGDSFNPSITPEKEISGTDVITGSATLVTFNSPSHGLTNEDKIVISGSNCSPIVDGLYSVTNCSTNTFDIVISSPFVSNGSYFAYSKASETTVSTNEEKPNRIYYSKLNQPDAVPILNYLNVGSEDKDILRIFPIRDSLFVFKEDGLYRISGEEAPFVVSLFDSSCILAAPDSVDVSNNIIYGWTTKGISNVSESGVTEISRPIDTEILKLASAQFPNFKTITWGVGYDSDNSYLVFTNTDPTDESATIAFRYSNLTNSWTNFIRTDNCGIVSGSDDRLYVGSGEDNIVHQERKTFSRFDYADIDFFLGITGSAVQNGGTRIYFPNVDEVSEGDVITQEQLLTNDAYNALLAKLDFDIGVGVANIASTSGASTTVTVNTVIPHGMGNLNYVNISNSNSIPSIDGTYQIKNVTPTSFEITVKIPLVTHSTTGKTKRNYELTLSAQKGDSLRQKVEELAAYLDTDPTLAFSDYAARVATYSGSIVSNAFGNPSLVTTSSPHNLVNGRVITITGTQTPIASIPPISGNTYTVGDTGIFGTSTTFTLPLNVTTSGSGGLTFNTFQNLFNIQDIKACFNGIVDRLNEDPGAFFNNYKLVNSSTLLEAVVTRVNKTANFIELNLPLPWDVGTCTIYKAIPCKLVYAPITFGDPLSIKQIYETTMMFENKAFTKATASFNTDLKPEFLGIEFYGQGNGIFGHYSSPGFGFGFFGGLSNGAPFRTIIPRQCQRGRYMGVAFEHKIAREKWSLNGITLTGNTSISTKGYR